MKIRLVRLSSPFVWLPIVSTKFCSAVCQTGTGLLIVSGIFASSVNSFSPFRNSRRRPVIPVCPSHETLSAAHFFLQHALQSLYSHLVPCNIYTIQLIKRQILIIRVWFTGRFGHSLHIKRSCFARRANFLGFLACFASFFILFLERPFSGFSSLSSRFRLESSSIACFIFFKCSSGGIRTYG